LCKSCANIKRNGDGCDCSPRFGNWFIPFNTYENNLKNNILWHLLTVNMIKVLKYNNHKTQVRIDTIYTTSVLINSVKILFFRIIFTPL